MNVNQEPKYMIVIETKAGYNYTKIVNRQSGEAIPDDEPLFILRARDINAIPLLEKYSNLIAGKSPLEHSEAVRLRLVQFKHWMDNNPERMKIPDTQLTEHWDELK